MTTKQDIVRNLTECLPAHSADIDPHADLLTTGVLDSASFLDFVSAVEQRFGVLLPDEAVFGNQFNTLSQVADTVMGLMEPPK